MPKIIIENTNLGGMSDSRYHGRKNSVALMEGIDIHSEPGIMKAEQDLSLISGSTIDERCHLLPASDGNIYAFGSSAGKIWKIESDNTITLVHTNTQGAILWADQHQGWIYYATATHLGRKIFPGLANWTDADDAWRQFAKTAPYRTMRRKNLVLYIADNNVLSQVARSSPTSGTGTISGSGVTLTGIGTLFTTEVQVDDIIRYVDANNIRHERRVVSIAGDLSLDVDAAFDPQPSGSSFWYLVDTFTSNALDLEEQYVIKSIGDISSDVVAGTTVGATPEQAIGLPSIFRWNTWSSSFTSSDPVPEDSIDAFVPTDNLTIAAAGGKGNLYLYNGAVLQRYWRIPGVWEGDVEARVPTAGTANYLGIPLVAINNETGTPVEQGIYAIGSYSRDYPTVLSLAYRPSKSPEAKVHSMTTAGNQLYVNWFHGSAVGVDKVDFTKKNPAAKIRTRVLQGDRSNRQDFTVEVFYRSLPKNTAIGISKRANYEATFSSMQTVVHDKQKKVVSKVTVSDAVACEFEIQLLPSGNNAPEIESIQITY